MPTIFYFVLFLIAITSTLWGADIITNNCVILARKNKVSEFVIGAILVSICTSTPELGISMWASSHEQYSMALGNIIGSSLFNLLFIVGLSAFFHPIRIHYRTIQKDIPLLIIASFLVYLFLFYGTLSRGAGVLFLVAFVGYLLFSFRLSEKRKEKTPPPTSIQPQRFWGIKLLFGMIILALSSNIVVHCALQLCHTFKISTTFAGLTILAICTSIPECITCFIASRKGQGGIVIGSIIGSNVINLLWVIGVTSLVFPFPPLVKIFSYDFLLLLGGTILFWYFSYTDYLLKKWEGALLFCIYIGYFIWVCYRTYIPSF